MGEGVVEFDRKYLRPFFIYDYSLEREKEVDEFDKAFIRKRVEQEDKIKDLMGEAFKARFVKSKSAIMWSCKTFAIRHTS